LFLFIFGDDSRRFISSAFNKKTKKPQEMKIYMGKRTLWEVLPFLDSFQSYFIVI